MASTLAHWSPFNDTLRVRPLRDMSGFMDDFFRLPLSEFPQTSFPPADVSEDGNAYTVTVEVPGIRREDIQLSVQDNTLSLRVTKSSDKKEEGTSYRHVERFYGTFERHFPFATTVDSNQVRASYKDGILEITLPKAESARERRIEIDAK